MLKSKTKLVLSGRFPKVFFELTKSDMVDSPQADALAREISHSTPRKKIALELGAGLGAALSENPVSRNLGEYCMSRAKKLGAGRVVRKALKSKKALRLSFPPLIEEIAKHFVHPERPQAGFRLGWILTIMKDATYHESAKEQAGPLFDQLRFDLDTFGADETLRERYVDPILCGARQWRSVEG